MVKVSEINLSKLLLLLCTTPNMYALFSASDFSFIFDWSSKMIKDSIKRSRTLLKCHLKTVEGSLVTINGSVKRSMGQWKQSRTPLKPIFWWCCKLLLGNILAKNGQNVVSSDLNKLLLYSNQLFCQKAEKKMLLKILKCFTKNAQKPFSGHFREIRVFQWIYRPKNDPRDHNKSPKIWNVWPKMAQKVVSGDLNEFYCILINLSSEKHINRSLFCQNPRKKRWPKFWDFLAKRGPKMVSGHFHEF